MTTVIEKTKVEGGAPKEFWSVWMDSDGYSIENEGGEQACYFNLDISGEGDYEDWNRRARILAREVCNRMNVLRHNGPGERGDE